METGAWAQGNGSWLHGNWCGKGENLGGGDSAFICITRMQCAQYSFNLLFQFIVDLF